MANLKERAEMREKGLASPFMSQIMSYNYQPLCEETLAIMAYICTQADVRPSPTKLQKFTIHCSKVQRLMPPSSTLRSTQVLALIACSVGIS